MGFFNNLGALRNREGHRNYHMGSVAPHPITLALMKENVGNISSKYYLLLSIAFRFYKTTKVAHTHKKKWTQLLICLVYKLCSKCFEELVDNGERRFRI